MTQSLACAAIGALAVLTLTHWITVWQIVCLALFQGFVNAFDVPARQAMTVEMVGTRGSAPCHLAQFHDVQPGAHCRPDHWPASLIALVGAGVCFALDAVSYAAVIVSLSLMRLRRAAAAQTCAALARPWPKALSMSGMSARSASRCC